VLVTEDARAVWVSHWPNPSLALDGLDAWRCTLFRNEGPVLSSQLVRAAMTATAEHWQDRPAAGWLTWVDTTYTASSNPGYCFQRAGWTLDREWRSRKSPALRRLRADSYR